MKNSSSSQTLRSVTEYNLHEQTKKRISNVGRWCGIELKDAGRTGRLKQACDLLFEAGFAVRTLSSFFVHSNLHLYDDLLHGEDATTFFDYLGIRQMADYACLPICFVTETNVRRLRTFIGGHPEVFGRLIDGDWGDKQENNGFHQGLKFLQKEALAEPACPDRPWSDLPQQDRNEGEQCDNAKDADGLKHHAADDLTLRPYQTEAKRSIFKAWESYRSVMFQMPTGTGKTRLFVSLIADIRKENPSARVLIVTHRKELVDQISGSLTNHYHIGHGILSGSESGNVESGILVASIQSLVKRGIAAPDYVIVDEAHHSLAPSYRMLWQMYPSARKLGVTATPYRLRKASFKELYEVLLVSLPMKEFIGMGYLAEYNFYTVSARRASMQRINRLTKFGADGDYQKKDLDEIFNRENEIEFLYRCYERYAAGRKGVVYAVNREHSERIAQRFRDHRVPAASIDSKTPAKERAALLRRFREGELRVLVNVELFTEGFDCPSIEFVMLSRPTRSLALYLQQVGRGLRPSPDGRRVTILDVAGLKARFGLPDRERDWHHYFEAGRHDSLLPLGVHDTLPEGELMIDATRADFSRNLECTPDGWYIRKVSNRSYIYDRALNPVAPNHYFKDIVRLEDGTYQAERRDCEHAFYCTLRFTPDLKLIPLERYEANGCGYYEIGDRSYSLFTLSLDPDAQAYTSVREFNDKWLITEGLEELTCAGLSPRTLPIVPCDLFDGYDCGNVYLFTRDYLVGSNGGEFRCFRNGFLYFYKRVGADAVLYNNLLHEVWRGERIEETADGCLLYDHGSPKPREVSLAGHIFENRLMPKKA